MKRTTLFTILMFFCFSLTACASDPKHLTDAQSSIFESLNVTHTDRSIVVKADAYLNITDASFLTVDLSEEEAVSITYMVTPETGNVTLSYTTPGEETVLLAEAGESTYGDTTITLEPGTTSFFLSGADVSCNLSFSVKDITMANVTAINDQAPDL